MFRRTLCLLSPSHLLCAAYVPAGSGLHLQVGSKMPPLFPPTYLYDSFAAPSPPVAVLDVSAVGEPLGRFSDDVSRLTSFHASLLKYPPSAPLPPPPSLPFLLSAIETYYSTYLEVIGMGENDFGVTFSGLYGDPLSSSPSLLVDLMNATREKRHGVKFHAVTTGLSCSPSSLPSLSAAGLRSVTLFLEGGSPTKYREGLLARGVACGDDSIFRQVTGFAAAAAEEGVKVKVGVRKGDAAASELAKGLGAVEVNMY